MHVYTYNYTCSTYSTHIHTYRYTHIHTYRKRIGEYLPPLTADNPSLIEFAHSQVHNVRAFFYTYVSTTNKMFDIYKQNVWHWFAMCTYKMFDIVYKQNVWHCVHTKCLTLIRNVYKQDVWHCVQTKCLTLIRNVYKQSVWHCVQTKCLTLCTNKMCTYKMFDMANACSSHVCGWLLLIQFTRSMHGAFWFFLYASVFARVFESKKAL